MDRKQKKDCVIVDEGGREIRRYRDAYYADFSELPRARCGICLAKAQSEASICRNLERAVDARGHERSSNVSLHS